MADNTKQVKYGELEDDFFKYSCELIEAASKKSIAIPEKGKSAGKTFMQAFFGHRDGIDQFCSSMKNLCLQTRELLNKSGAEFKEIDDKIACVIERGH